MKYYIISGEASGDLHGSNLIKELKRIDSSTEFRCWGGDLMMAQGAEIVKHYRDLAFMGFLEVLMNIRTIFSNISFCKKDILKFRPDALILIDYPGFNLRIAKFAKKNNIKVIYYISPQIWAWKESRVNHIKKYVDRMLVILPFEKDFYKKHNYNVDFVGHPLIDAFSEIKYESKNFEDFISKNQLPDKPVIALVPGSRKQEISNILPLMLESVVNFKDYQFVITGVKSVPETIYKNCTGNFPVKILYGKTYELLSYSKAALVTSGTATLETALLRIPEIVCYKSGYISYRIARWLIKVPYISLVNLIMNRPVLKELIQFELNPHSIEKELNNILTDQAIRNKMLADYDELTEKLGGKGASAKAAGIIFEETNR